MFSCPKNCTLGSKLEILESCGFLFTPDWYFSRVVGLDIDPLQIQEANQEAVKRFYLINICNLK